MTVQEMIEYLKTLPPNTEVLEYKEGEDWEEPEYIQLNANTWRPTVCGFEIKRIEEDGFERIDICFNPSNNRKCIII